METSPGKFELSLNVVDLSASIEFYSALGFEPAQGDGHTWREMRSGPLSIGLYQGHVSSNLITFFTPEVAGIAARLAEAGLAAEQGPEVEDDGSTGLTLRDPDGNRIYING
jgi:hypothetical protein